MNEIALGNAPVYFINEDLSSIGLHFHYLRKQKNGKMWAGFFYERIFQESSYNNIGLTASYSIIDEWQISLTPGISFSTQDQTVQYMMLFESSYKFIIHDFHLGPFLSAGYDIQGYRLSLGLHLGYGF